MAAVKGSPSGLRGADLPARWSHLPTSFSPPGLQSSADLHEIGHTVTHVYHAGTPLSTVFPSGCMAGKAGPVQPIRPRLPPAPKKPALTGGSPLAPKEPALQSPLTRVLHSQTSLHLPTRKHGTHVEAIPFGGGGLVWLERGVWYGLVPLSEKMKKKKKKSLWKEKMSAQLVWAFHPMKQPYGAGAIPDGGRNDVWLEPWCRSICGAASGKSANAAHVQAPGVSRVPWGRIAGRWQGQEAWRRGVSPTRGVRSRAGCGGGSDGGSGGAEWSRRGRGIRYRARVTVYWYHGAG